MQWLSKLMPKQKMQDVGEGSIQVGSVGGDLTHSQKTMNQTIYNTIYVVASDPPANESRSAPLTATPAPVIDKKSATQAQLEVLRLMRQSPAANAYAEEFMQQHFKTTRVKSLDNLQCKRTKRWVEVCLENGNTTQPKAFRAC